MEEQQKKRIITSHSKKLNKQPINDTLISMESFYNAQHQLSKNSSSNFFHTNHYNLTSPHFNSLTPRLYQQQFKHNFITTSPRCSNENPSKLSIKNSQQFFKQKKSNQQLRSTCDGNYPKSKEKQSKSPQCYHIVRDTVPNFIKKNKSFVNTSNNDFGASQNQTKIKTVKQQTDQNINKVTRKIGIPPLPTKQKQYKSINQYHRDGAILIENNFIKRQTKYNKQQQPQDNYEKHIHQRTISSNISPRFSVLKKDATLQSHFKHKSTANLSIEQKISINSFQLGLCKNQERYMKTYPAKHKITGFLCLIKQIKKKLVINNLDIFIRQLKLQCIVDSEYIVKVYGLFSDHENIYIINELMQQGSLFCYLKIMKVLEESQIARIIRQITLGLLALHQFDIIHRDVKPQNILLSFGVCKIDGFSKAIVGVQRRSTLCGTKGYICPQILEGGSYDKSIDVWCLGVMGYEMMQGKPPFYNMSRKGTIKKINDCEIRFGEKVSEEAKQFLINLLRKDPEKRIEVQKILHQEFIQMHRKRQTLIS